MDFEALAAECRSDTFRHSLAASDEWVRSAEAELAAALRQLSRSFTVVGNREQEENPRDAAAAAANDGDGGGGDEDDDGLGYTIRVSKRQVASGLDTGDFAPTSVEVREHEGAVHALASATSALRLLRNACVSCRANQATCGASSALRLTHEIVMGCCGWVDVDDDDVKGAVVLLAQVALQFLVNCVTGYEANQAAVWALFFPDHFQKVLVECQEHRKIVAFAVALLLNCVNAPQAEGSECAVRTRRVDLVCARNLVITVLQRCLVKPAARPSSDATAATLLPADAVDAQDPAFEWICVLFRVLFEAEYAKDLYNAVGAHMLSKLWSRVTPEQLILLRMLTLWVTSKAASPNQPPSTTSTTPAQKAASPALFEFLTNTWMYVITEGDEDRPEEADEMRKRVWIGLENEAKLLLLDALGEVTQVAELIATEYAERLLVSLLEELHRVWQLRRLGAKKPAASAVSAESDADSEPLGYRSGIIRAVGNLSFRHERHQDIVRERGHLTLFLSHCNVDDANPLLREWALVALRNLCEGNEANQQYINALKPKSREESTAAAQTAEGGGSARFEEVVEP